jgi:methyltransferase-like protein
MVRVNHKSISNRSQYTWASSEPSSPTTASPEYTNTPENQVADLKSYFMKIIYSFKEDINNSLKEIQENTSKQVEALKEETNKSLKGIQKNTIKEEKESKPRPKSGSRNNKQNTNRGKHGYGKPRKEVRNYSITNRVQDG